MAVNPLLPAASAALAAAAITRPRSAPYLAQRQWLGNRTNDFPRWLPLCSAGRGALDWTRRLGTRDLHCCLDGSTTSQIIPSQPVRDDP